MTVRPTIAADIAPLQTVLDATRLFPSEMLPDLIAPFLSQTSDDLWLTCDADGQPVGFCYAAPEELALGTWNMRAIAVLPETQGSGYGAALTGHLEATLRERGHRILIADTSGTDDFAPTRAFYRKTGYIEEARIRDFWGKGDDKIVFWKSLG